jgi:hypothetical protein
MVLHKNLLHSVSPKTIQEMWKVWQTLFTLLRTCLLMSRFSWNSCFLYDFLRGMSELNFRKLSNTVQLLILRHEWTQGRTRSPHRAYCLLRSKMSRHQPLRLYLNSRVCVPLCQLLYSRGTVSLITEARAVAAAQHTRKLLTVTILSRQLTASFHFSETRTNWYPPSRYATKSC